MADDKRRLIIVSLDAVGKKDMDFMLGLPNFSKIVSSGAFCNNVLSVYPSLTYPAHTSIITGKKPDNHRIVSNTCFQPSRSNPDWLYKKKYINGTTIVDEAKKADMKVCSFLWPVMGGAKIEYNIPEVCVTRKYQNQVTACVANGTPLYLLEMQKLFGHMRKGTNQPELDNFLMACAEYTIEKYDPDMLLIHLTDVDTTRHNFGADNEKVREALKRHDKRLGDLLSWFSAKRPMDNTTFIVLGDHCQRDANKIVYLNKFLLDKGFLDVKNGKIKDYRVIAKSCDGSVYLYLNPDYRNNPEVLEKVADVINEIRHDERLGIEAVYTAKEASEMGADGECLVMFEGKPGVYFLNEFDTLTEKVNETSNHKMMAIHGCLPTNEDNITFFAATGRGIKAGGRPESMHLWDEGPTIAKLMGWNLSDADGMVIEDILE